MPTQTVREALQTAARLRLPRSTSYEERQESVERVLRELQLEPFASQMIGKPVRIFRRFWWMIDNCLIMNHDYFLVFLHTHTHTLFSLSLSLSLSLSPFFHRTGHSSIFLCFTHPFSLAFFSHFSLLCLSFFPPRTTGKYVCRFTRDPKTGHYWSGAGG